MADNAVDCSKGSVPAAPLAGTLNGGAFALDSVTLDPNNKRAQNDVAFDEYHVYLTGKDGVVFDVTALTLAGKLPDGKTFRSGLDGDSPEAAAGTAEIQGWNIDDESKNLEIDFSQVDDASLQIVFGQRAGKTLPAQIHFCVPSKQTDIGGGFTIPLP